jgi:hypothetical protein
VTHPPGGRAEKPMAISVAFRKPKLWIAALSVMLVWIG